MFAAAWVQMFRGAFCPRLHVRNSKGGLYWHVFHHHCAERHFVCSGTKQLRAIMSMFQYLRRSAALIRSSVGALSCTHRLHVDDEFSLLLSGSGPCLKEKEARTGTLPVRRVGNMHCRTSIPVAVREQAHDISEPFPVRHSASWLRVGPHASGTCEDKVAYSGGRPA